MHGKTLDFMLSRRRDKAAAKIVFQACNRGKRRACKGCDRQERRKSHRFAKDKRWFEILSVAPDNRHLAGEVSPSHAFPMRCQATEQYSRVLLSVTAAHSPAGQGIIALSRKSRGPLWASRHSILPLPVLPVSRWLT